MAPDPDTIPRATPDAARSRAFGLPAAVWLLGLGSLLNDTASEAIYPLLPLFLTTVLGAGAFSLGVIEGGAEAANSLLKIFSGYFSDRWNMRRPVVVSGYAVASVARPFIALIRSWPQLFLIRFVDRVGKGIRSAPRDAMLAGWATPCTRGRVFGFHRAMDHVGAVLGPSLATIFLLYQPGRYRLLFGLTVVPGLLAVLMVALAREREAHTAASREHEGQTGAAREHEADTAAARGYVAQDFGPVLHRAPSFRPSALPARFYGYMAVLLLFTLGNSSDAFLLLRLSDAGVSAFWIPLLWAGLHVVKATVSVYGGNLSDRWSRRSVIGIGWAIYALVYGAFAVSQSITALVVWFLVYGVYYGFSEGVEKALVADYAPAGLRGTAFGLYNAVIGLGALAASLVFGYVWTLAGPASAFGMGAVLALAATVALFAVIGRRPAEPETEERS
jgi:MFS family permease